MQAVRMVRAARVRGPWLAISALTVQLQARSIAHRHCHVRSPAENGHWERFNRTTQDECLRRVSRSLQSYRAAIPEYLRYYNSERPHLGLQMQSPLQVV